MKLDSAKLITARHRKGMNQTKLAEACGVSIVTISNAENEKDVYPATGLRICEILEISLAEVVLPVESEGKDGDAA